MSYYIYYSRGTTLPTESTPAVRQVPKEELSLGLMYHTPAELGERDVAARGTRSTHRGTRSTHRPRSARVMSPARSIGGRGGSPPAPPAASSPP
jgi:hypothetical protein